jgi:RNA-directed DNA polymerase
MFNEIMILSEKNNLLFSLYVDDMAFSGGSYIPKNFHLQINQILKKYGHKIKNKKVKYYSKNQKKIITGCLITEDNKLKVLNKHRKSIVELLAEYRQDKEEYIYKRLIGKIQSAQQIEKSIFNESKKMIKLKSAFI